MDCSWRYVCDPFPVLDQKRVDVDLQNVCEFYELREVNSSSPVFGFRNVGLMFVHQLGNFALLNSFSNSSRREHLSENFVLFVV